MSMKLIDIIVLDKSIILQISTLKERGRERERNKKVGKSLFLFPLVIIIVFKNKRNNHSIDRYDNSFLTFNISKRSWENFLRLM